MLQLARPARCAAPMPVPATLGAELRFTPLPGQLTVLRRQLSEPTLLLRGADELLLEAQCLCQHVPGC